MLRFGAAVAVFAVAVRAGCPNSCSGHGTCGASDICTCYDNWRGADCSQRECAHGKSWAVDAADPHGFSECSGQGVCDRNTGECKCFSGFTGRACTRSLCPNDCSGNGECKLLGDLAGSNLLALPYASTNWDVDRIQTCVCDNGFFGPDCSQRYCPTGDDPLTTCASTHTRSYQELRLTLGSAVAWDPTSTVVTPTYAIHEEAMDYFGTSGTVAERAARAAAPGAARVTFTDQFGGRFVAHAATHAFVTADADAQANDALEAALESLPQQRVSNVIVASALTSAGSNGGLAHVLERRYVVTFVPDTTSSVNVGPQRPLTCDSGYSCTEAGCAPVVAMPFLYRYAGMDADVRIGTPLVTAGAPGSANIQFYTGSRNADADWAAGAFVRLAASSQPQMPFNVPVDAGVSAASPARFDLRVLVAVVDPANALDDANDIVYVRVVAGHTNITSNLEAVGFPGWPGAPAYTGVWGAIAPTGVGPSPAKPWRTTLSGFTPLGPIVADALGEFKMAVPGAPGVQLHFPKANIVANDGWGRWYEVLAKLPHCAVNALSATGGFAAIDGSPLDAVDPQVENVECSNRGACDRGAGLCKCFEGFYGPACSKQTTLA